VNFSRHVGRAGAGLAGAAVAVRLLTLAVSPGVRAIDAVAAGLALCVGAFLLTRPAPRRADWIEIDNAAAVVLAVLTAIAITAAGAALPDFTLVAAIGFGAILVGTGWDGRPSFRLAVDAAVLAAFVVTWIVGAPRGSPAPSLLVAVAGLAALKLLLMGAVIGARSSIDAETRRGHVYAALGRRVGFAGDVLSVARGVLEACHETFPQASTGMILVHDPADGLLKSPGIALSPAGVAPGGPAYELAPGEGLGGTVYASGRTALWPTTLAASMAQASLREANRVRLRQSNLGFIRSAIGAPLRADGTAVGVILLTSDHREHAWGDEDLPVMDALADEAARSLERARRHEEEMGHALLDAVTGLATRRQLLTVLDKELARASRAEGGLAVVMFDLDGFRDLNTRLGHDTGNRVLGAFADVLRAILRREDSAARSGGDEFVCVLPGADRDQARAVAARIQQRFTAATADDRSLGDGGASASAGVAVFPGDSETEDGLLAAAAAEVDAVRTSRELTGRPRPWSPVPDVTAT